jgi:hypothetical protein
VRVKKAAFCEFLPNHPGLRAHQRSTKETFCLSNIWLHVVQDHDGFFGGHDDYAMKAANAWIRGAVEYGAARIPGLQIPLATVVDYRGFRVLCVADVPSNAAVPPAEVEWSLHSSGIDASNKNLTFVQGLSTDGKHVVSTEARLQRKLARAGACAQ